MEIVDPENKLSKTQKSKIRAMIKNNESKSKIIDSIYYEDNAIRYKDFEIEDISENTKRIVFSNKDQREELSKKLKDRLHQYKTTRKNRYKSDAWRMYYKVLQHPIIKKLPEESVKTLVPNPDKIRTEAEQYRSTIDMIPIPLIKDYINTCLSE